MAVMLLAAGAAHVTTTEQLAAMVPPPLSATEVKSGIELREQVQQVDATTSGRGVVSLSTGQNGAG